MGWGNSGTRNQNAPCPDPNKHCGDAIPPGASIDIWVWKAIGITFALTFAYLVCNPKKRRLVSDFLSLVWMFIIFKKRKV